MSHNNWLLLAVVCFTLSAAAHAKPSYQEQWRLQYHFSPEKNWMNDPNGLLYYRGKYHLFYQYNPFGIRWGHMSWGHAVSEDLVHWEHWPIAIPETGDIMAFSGSAVADVHNTSGFSRNGAVPLVAIYTGYNSSKAANEKQDQRLSYSLDGGRSWTMYAGNPVLQIEEHHFRDPKVIWYEPSQSWIMLVAKARDNIFQFYSSPNLKDWTYMSDLGPNGTIPTGEWECPDLFPLNVTGETGVQKWVLPISVGKDSVPRRGVMYFIGSFNGTHFTPDEPVAKYLDFGEDFYAANSWNNFVDGRRLWMGWMCSWRYCQDIETNPWRGAQTMVRVLSLERENGGDIVLLQKPIKEMGKLRTGVEWKYRNTDITTVKQKLTTDKVHGRLLEVKAEFKPKAGTEKVGFSILQGPIEETLVGYNHVNKTVYVDRSRSGFIDPRMGTIDVAKVYLQGGILNLHFFVDWSSVEVFANGGRQVITNRVFPNKTDDGFGAYVIGSDIEVVNLEIYELKTTWQNYWTTPSPTTTSGAAALFLVTSGHSVVFLCSVVITVFQYLIA
ncbi:uncharacterized protein LOC106154361 [Lingula anatina]|uniref:Uncharacterized protein LOC106154361 n=1 Tax=Lingula anatina TaxID=7574 RepID=A0A1S3HF73_LINAN|nr:uncharacterized protein LOC106154361 [Lingula anatina]XP_013384147.1 uncharacterized protein LOC106154361 [Lingula anatina]|eukprot:XP_013384146.1 uncharacterized protein LOC106154361 [Lingula anatina]